MGEVVPFLHLSSEARRLQDELSRRRAQPPEEVPADLIRKAAGEELSAPDTDGPVLVLEAIEEVPAIGPEGRGKRIHPWGINETGEWDAGEVFVPDGPRSER
ncbi:MAG: hypothetical protein DIJKHBIC_04637 [Thermoanaerobaculia bacterium]|nr:hypothetical protein [Thermoanaerobaculia bacterium]